MADEIKVFASASVTNVGPGFDIMGFALEEPGDEVTVRFSKIPGIRITNIKGDGENLPLEPEKNTAGASLISLAKYLGISEGIELEINKKMRIGSGLGSSAASAVASVFALNELSGRKLTKNQLLLHALEGEKITSGGTPHADNISACLFGGFVIVRSLSPVDVINIPTPENLYCVVITPFIEVSTAEARKVMPKEIPLETAVTQWGNIAGLVAGLMKGDFEIIKRSLKDVVSEPVRSKLIPGYEGIKNAALDAGAFGANISGSGPSVFALCESIETAKIIGEAMQTVVNSLNIESALYISKINQNGPRVI
ncbi:MAG TPA: homoserine kinase [Ignavibacteriaceae bacterium]|nr:homoserine kinase [Ignavibacteriaceae bacterium]